MHALLLIPFLVTDPAPLMPAGSSTDFQATAYKVEQLLGASKFEEAKVLIKRLPTYEVGVRWDDSAVPEDLRDIYAQARDGAIADWTKAIPELKVKLTTKAEQIRVSFKETLPPPTGSLRPAGAVFFSSDAPSDPRIEAVIGLKRDTPLRDIDRRHVQNEMGYAIGAYLGLGRLPRPVGYMGRMDTMSLLQLRVNRREVELVRENMAFIKTLAEAATKKIPLVPTKPEMFVNPKSLAQEQAHQGDVVQFSMDVANRGNAPLKLSTFVECSCVHVSLPDTVQPGSTGLVQVHVDTSQLTGDFEKTFVLFTNDPERAETVVPIKMYVVPRYRLLKPNPGALLLSDKGEKSEVFLAIDPERMFKVTGVKINGLNAAVDYEPWEGKMADLDLGEAEKARKGYKITFLPSPTARKGRVPVTFGIVTDNKDMPAIFETVYVQWGIVAMPESLEFGQIAKTRTEAFFYVSRPGKPFKVLKVESGSDFVQTSFEPAKNGDYRVKVVILPTVSVGKLNEMITVTTDDPKQPTVSIELSAVVK